MHSANVKSSSNPKVMVKPGVDFFMLCVEIIFV